MKKKKIVFTNGCFDVLHKGHVFYLRRARKLGDVLIVGLNSDLSVRKIKGFGRPVNSQDDRAELLSELKCVDRVIIFNEDTPEKLIRKIRPDILVKGGDWKGKEIAGGAFVRSYGGRVQFLPFVVGFSTTELLAKIEKL